MQVKSRWKEVKSIKTKKGKKNKTQQSYEKKIRNDSRGGKGEKIREGQCIKQAKADKPKIIAVTRCLYTGLH